MRKSIASAENHGKWSARPTTALNEAILRRRSERGVALILTLAIIALVTLLLIAFVTSMRVENAASKNYNELIKARELAKGAIDQAVAQIRQATPSRVPGADGIVNYVTYPGGAYVYQNGALTSYSLYSDPLLNDPTNLNAGLWITGGTNGAGEFGAVPPANSQITVGWLYVAQDGTVGPPSVAATAHGPLVGRIAYWVDDEASKINVNTAGVPPACSDPFGGCSASNDVDLTMLLPSPFTALASSIQIGAATQPYTTDEEIKRANVNLTAAVFDDNRFEVTAYSNDANYPGYADDLDVFDRQRMVISTLNTPRDIDGTLDATGTISARTRLSDLNLALLYGSGSSATPNAFASKYPGNGVEQLVANIIAYQQDPSVKPPPDSNPNPAAPFTPPIYLGLGKTPYINEVQVQYALQGIAPNVTVHRTVFVELNYMYDGQYTNGIEQILLSGLPNILGFSTTATIPIAAGGLISSGTYPIYKETDALTPALSVATAFPPATSVFITYRRQYGGVMRRLNFAQMAGIGASGQTLDPAAPAGTIIYQGAQAGDPCLNGSAAQWEAYPNAKVSIGTMGTYTLGSRNVWNGTPPGPPGASMGRSYPFIATTPTADSSKFGIMRGQLMQSIGELGYIHTPNPFQYVTLQPGGGSTAGQIPDWAMLDLFTVGAGTGGRININGWINANPNVTTPQPVTPRLVPLNALLNGAGISSPSSVAQHIYYDEATDRGSRDTYGMANGRFGVFDTIGEICEIPSLANGQTTQAAKEAAIRRIANLITVRSSTFTIWVLAQSIKQPPSNPTPGTYNPTFDIITGEVKAQAVVERYETLPVTAGNTPKYRTRYFRYLYN
jgi:hypothetical protein